jgi:hypothetical protein
MNSLALCCRVSSILASSGRDSDLNRKKIHSYFRFVFAVQWFDRAAF